MKTLCSREAIILKVGKMATDKILVTGGAGFVGSHLCERLVAEGNEVWSLDNYFTGRLDNHVDGVKYIHNSTMNIMELNIPSFDTVYHLGEYSRVEQSFEDFAQVWEFNKLGTYEVLKFVKRHMAKLVYAGSSTKFVDEPGYIQSPYAWSKASNTEFVNRFCEWNDLKYAITYFYNVYGPRELADGHYATLIAKFAKKMKAKEKLGVVLPGTQTRNFTHVHDIVEGLMLAGKYGQGDEYGIGHPDAYSVREIAEFFGGEIIDLPARKGNRMGAPVVSEKIRDLGWEPKYDVKQYIEDLKDGN